MEMQAEAERRKRENILKSEGDHQSEISLPPGKRKDCDSVEQQSSVQDPGAHSQQEEKLSRARNQSFDQVKIRFSNRNRFAFA